MPVDVSSGLVPDETYTALDVATVSDTAILTDGVGITVNKFHTSDNGHFDDITTNYEIEVSTVTPIITKLTAKMIHTQMMQFNGKGW